MARLTAVLAVLLTTLLVAAAAAGDPGTDKARLDARIGDLRERADRASETAGVLTTELASIGHRARAAEAAVAVEQARLASLEASLAAERVRLASLERTIAAQSARLVVLQREYDVALDTLERHLRALYEADDPDIIGFALGATSFSELLDHYDLLNRIGRQDERIASSLADAHAELEQARAETERAREGAARSEALVAARTTAQRAARDRIVASKNELLAARREKSAALASIGDDREEYLAEADALAAESAALAARIVAAQQAAAAAAASAGSPSSGSAAPSGSGRLGWPVAGPVTSGFGWRWGRMHEGIDIAVGTGTPVHAAEAGTVIYAGWLGGYGNLIVIDHGEGLSTAYAHNSSLIVGQGAAVGRGFVVALSGNTGNSSGPHVHFEVRVGGGAVDPIGYL
jgi:murein DD-endopeptidase MepM/ murein hydrolase activator NlpD